MGQPKGKCCQYQALGTVIEEPLTEKSPVWFHNGGLVQAAVAMVVPLTKRPNLNPLVPTGTTKVMVVPDNEASIQQPRLPVPHTQAMMTALSVLSQVGLSVIINVTSVISELDEEDGIEEYSLLETCVEEDEEDDDSLGDEEDSLLEELDVDWLEEDDWLVVSELPDEVLDSLHHACKIMPLTAGIWVSIDRPPPLGACTTQAEKEKPWVLLTRRPSGSGVPLMAS